MRWYWNGYCMGLIDGKYMCFESVDDYVAYYREHERRKEDG